MDILTFLAWTLVTIHAVALLWPVNIVLMALAVKIQHGTTPVPFETNEYWWRSTFAALGLALLSAVLVGLAYVLVHVADLPDGPMHLLLLLIYLPLAVAYVFWMFALDDVLQALSIYGIYVLLPGLVLLLVARLLGWLDLVQQHAPWLLTSS